MNDTDRIVDWRGAPITDPEKIAEARASILDDHENQLHAERAIKIQRQKERRGSHTQEKANAAPELRGDQP